MKKIRVAILTEIMSPYRIPLFNALAKFDDLELYVFFFSKTVPMRQWRIPKEKINFNYKVLRGAITSCNHRGHVTFLNLSIISELLKGRHNVIIVGGFQHLTNWLAFIYSCLTRKSLILFSESTLKDMRSGNIIKEWLKRLFVRYSSGYLVPGIPQVQYLLSLGAKRDKIWIAPNSVDSDLFSRALDQRKHDKAHIKQELGVKGEIILYVGRMIDEKGVADLIEVFLVVQRRCPLASLVLVGEGPDRKMYEAKCRRKNISNVIFTGFKEQEELSKYYAIADLFVFPTHTDPWGMVINEAMLAGLPIICSFAAGAADSLIKQGENGFLHKPCDRGAMIDYICCLLNDRNLREVMGTRSKEIISSYTPLNMAVGFRKAIIETFGLIS